MLSTGSAEEEDSPLPMLCLSLPEVEIEVLRQFVEFVYTGKISCCGGVQDLVKLGRLADVLDVRSLQEMVESAARRIISVQTCCSLLQFSIDCGLTALTSHCTRFVHENFVAVTLTEGFPRLNYEVVEALLADDRLTCTHEETVYEGLSMWLSANSKQAESHAVNCTAHCCPATDAHHEPATADKEKTGPDSAPRELFATQRMRLKQLISTVRFALIPDAYLREVVCSDADRLGCLELEEVASATISMPVADRLAVRGRGGCGPKQQEWLDMQVAWTLKGHAGSVDTLAVYGEHRVISGSRDGSIRVWNTQTGACEGVLSMPGDVACGSVYKLLVHGDTLFSGSQCKGKGPLHAWSLANMQYVRAMEGHSDAVMSMAARGECLWTGSWDATVREWNVRSLECVRLLTRGMSGPVLSLALCGDTIVCNSAAQGTEVWHIASGDRLQALLPAEKQVTRLASVA